MRRIKEAIRRWLFSDSDVDTIDGAVKAWIDVDRRLTRLEIDMSQINLARSRKPGDNWAPLRPGYASASELKAKAVGLLAEKRAKETKHA